MAQKTRPQAETLSGSPQPNFIGYQASAIIAKRAPTSSDTGYPLGQLWVDKTNNGSYQLSSVSAGSATWLTLASGGGQVATLTGDSGGAISPSAGNINVLGTTNQITTTGSGHTITWSLPAAITAPGSLTTTTSLSATTTVTAGTGVTATTGGITATAGDITATAGNVVINGAAKQLQVHGGAVTDFIGTGTLTNGTVTIANTNIAATDRIFIQRTAANASTTLGELSYTINAATNFVVTSLILGTPGSTQTGDVSSFVYFIARQV